MSARFWLNLGLIVAVVNPTIARAAEPQAQSPAEITRLSGIYKRHENGVTTRVKFSESSESRGLGTLFSGERTYKLLVEKIEDGSESSPSFNTYLYLCTRDESAPRALSRKGQVVGLDCDERLFLDGEIPRKIVLVRTPPDLLEVFVSGGPSPIDEGNLVFTHRLGIDGKCVNDEGQEANEALCE